MDPTPILVMGLGGLCLLVFVAAIVLALTMGLRRQGLPVPPDRVERLEAENKRLREEIAGLERERQSRVPERGSQHVREGIVEPKMDQPPTS